MPNPQDGNYRFVAERRQYGGLLMLTGFCALIQPLAGMATRVGPDGPLYTDAGTSQFWQFVGACLLFAIGVCSMLVGYLEFIHDWGEITHSALLIVLTQSAFIPYISDMARVGFIMIEDPPQFFQVFTDPATGLIDPAGIINQRRVNQTDEVLFIGSVGIFGVFAYAFAFVGTISFMQFALYAFRKGRPQDRNGDYFRGRLGFYSIMLFIGGLCQILLGSFATEFLIDNGRIQGGYLQVAMFVVHVPYLTIVVGSLQFLIGFWGFCRSCYVFVGGRDDYTFQYAMAFLWLVVLTCQGIVQPALLPAGTLAAAVPTFVALSFGAIFMPAYLDHKMRNTPMNIDEDYYFGPEPTKSDEEKPMIQAKNPKDMPKKKPPVLLKRVYVMERPGAIIDDSYYYNGPNGQHAAPYKPKKEKVVEESSESESAEEDYGTTPSPPEAAPLQQSQAVPLQSSQAAPFQQSQAAPMQRTDSEPLRPEEEEV